MSYSRSRLSSFFLPMSALVMAVVFISSTSLIEFYYTEQKQTLRDLNSVVEIYADIIKAIHQKTQDRHETIEILRDAYTKSRFFQKNGVFQLGYRDGNQIKKLIFDSENNRSLEDSLPIKDHPDIPMVRALENRFGSEILLDVNDEKVMAAYTYIDSLDMAFLAKVPVRRVNSIFFILAPRLFGLGALVCLAAFFGINYFSRQQEKLEKNHRDEINKTMKNLNNYKKGLDVHSMVAIADEKGQIIEANEAFCQKTGYTFSEIEGHRFSIFNSGYHPDEFFSNLWSTINQGKVWHGQIKNRRKDGTHFWVNTTIAPLVEEDADRYICIQTEITAEKEYENYLIEAKKEAESANERKTTLLAHISHEIRTPLSSIIGYIELIARDQNLRSQTSNYVQTIQRNSQHLLNLVDEILDFSKIEANQLEVKEVTVPLAREMRKIKDIFEKRSNRIRFSIQSIAPLPEKIHTDPLRFEQILINLIGNSFKFTEKGEIKALFRLSDKNKGEPDGKLAVDISDTGIGIRPEDKEKIFEPFTQTHSFYTRDKMGTGLGLSLSRELAQILGGDVRLVNSQPGQGSQFTVFVGYGDPKSTKMMDRLPNFQSRWNQEIKPEKELKTIDDNLAKLIRPLDSIKVLLVEDSIDISELLRINLEERGASVLVAATGFEAIEKMKDNVFDIILLDIQLPKMSGHQLIRKVQRMQPLAPVIALTAHSIKDERDQCIRSGFNDFLTKPVDFEKLTSAIVRWNGIGRDLYDKLAPEINKPLYSAIDGSPRVKAQIESFVEHLLEKVALCITMTEEQNWGKLKKYGHQLKGAFSTYGYPEMAELAEKLESLCETPSHMSDEKRSEALVKVIFQIKKLAERAQIPFSDNQESA